MTLVPIYASVLSLFFVALSIRTLRLRRGLRIAVGDGGNPQMLRAMRAHSNFAEYVPLALVLLFFVESQGASVYLVHALGITLTLGRFSHAYGISRTPENFRFRVFGMASTFICLNVSAIYLLVVHLFF